MWVGDENKLGETRFRFCCPNEECFEKTKDSYFFFTYEKAPKRYPAYIKCPDCGRKASFAPLGPGISFKGNGWTPKFHDKSSNESRAREHYQQHIRDTKDALEFKSGVSPYAKMEIDHEYWAKKGVARKVSEKERSEREKVGKKIAQDAGKNMSKEDLKNVGKRSNG